MVETEERLVEIATTATVDRISAAWREQLPSIFEPGNLLEAAKAELVHGALAENPPQMAENPPPRLSGEPSASLI